MILVGQYDSPFVRRVAVTLHVYGHAFTRDRTSVFAPEFPKVNPLVRIPSLVPDDGEPLFDSAAILDYLDESAGEAALTPRTGVARRRVLQATVLATGAIDKAGTVVYERHFHETACVATKWVARCLGQLDGALAHLDRAASTPWFFGERLTQADITVGCLIGFVRLRLAEAFPPGRFPSLTALAARCDELEAFRETRPAPDETMPW